MWIFTVLLYLGIAAAGYHRAKTQGTWSWLEFLFAISFCVLDGCILILPLIYIPQHSRWFAPGVAAGALVAAGNFVWFLYLCRHWKLPDGRTSLQAWKDRHPPASESTPE